MKVTRVTALAVCAFALCAGTAAATPPPQIFATAGVIGTARSYLLTLPQPQALGAGAVTVTQNGYRVRDLTVSRVGTSSQSSSALVLEIDESSTMKGSAITGALAASRQIVEEAGPDEEIAIVAFNRAITVLEPFTTDHASLIKTLRAPPTLRDGARLDDALEQGVSLISDATVSTGSIVLFANGGDVGSTATPGATLAMLKGADVRVFPLALSSRRLDQAPLSALSAATGGSFEQASDLSTERSDGVKLGSRLAGEYMLRYHSSVNPKTHVLVAVRVRGVAGRATATYMSPPVHLTPAPVYTAPPPSGPSFARSPWALALVVALVAGLVYGMVRMLLGPRRQPVIDRIAAFVSLGDSNSGEGAQQEANPYSLLDRAQASIESRPWSMQLGETLDLADIKIPVGKFVLALGAGAVVAAVLGNLMIGTNGAVIGFVLVPIGARIYVRRALKRKRKAFADQLPDALDILASALRAGNSLVGGLAVVADDSSEPTRAELRRVLAEEQFGVAIEDGLMVTSVRMANRDVEQLALVARLGREMGANTAEVLDRVVETVRGRMELRRLVSSLTAQGRLSRWILTLMPVAIAILIDTVDPGYMSKLFGTTIGVALLVVAVIMVSLGSFVIGKIVDIKA